MTFEMGTTFSLSGVHVNSIINNNTDGPTSTAMQQGANSLLLLVLVVLVPMMAAAFLHGTLGSALTESMLTRTGERHGPPGQPAPTWHQGWTRPAGGRL